MDTPLSKGDKFSLKQCPKNELEIKEMQRIPYASTAGSLMYAQVCTRPDITFIVGMLGRYLSNPGMEQWKAIKQVLRYLKKIKDYMLTYRKSDHLEIIGYSDSDFGGCKDERKSTSGYVYLLAGRAISWRPLKIFCDNKSAVEYSNNNRSTTDAKHIDIKFLVVKEKIQSGQSSIEHIGTNSMIADRLTKALTPKNTVDRILLNGTLFNFLIVV
ncbi:secreted RxLR effector protein 161-like [Apium graveolens]|uniref:secreted RxLR effector protein 161-like n=1 Tax=Apium graveolens TaxID=4045 RepID=UPI003D79F3AA